jgi:oligoribonuclease NrnB/cAMP/cGMP phosphodiesterase (DHH superfamily)
MKDNLKVFHLTHFDLDGVSSAIVLHNYFKDIKSVPIGYNRLDSTIFKVGVDPDYSGFDCIISTDLNLRREHVNHLSSFGIPYIHLDHHQDVDKVHNGKNIIVDTTKCGAMVTRDFIQNVIGANVTHLDELIKYTDDYDRWIHKLEWSKPLNYLFEMYGFTGFLNRFINGFDPKELTKTEKTFIIDKVTANNNYWTAVKETMVLSDDTKCAVIFVDPAFANEMCDRVLRTKSLNTDMVFAINTKSWKVHLRTSPTDFNVGKFLTGLNIGGGHENAGAFEVAGINKNSPMDDSQKVGVLIDNIEKIEKIIQKIYPKINK